MSRRALLLATLAAMGSSLAMAGTARAQAQVVNLPPNGRISATNTVTIGGTFSVNVGSLVQNGIQANPCNPGACYDVTDVVHSNQRWQLQVTLSAPSPNFDVAWIEKPLNLRHPLSAGVYQTIATGTGPTPAQNVAVMYNATRTTAKGGIVPTAAQVQAVLTYRVIALP